MAQRYRDEYHFECLGVSTAIFQKSFRSTPGYMEFMMAAFKAMAYEVINVMESLTLLLSQQLDTQQQQDSANFIVKLRCGVRTVTDMHANPAL